MELGGMCFLQAGIGEDLECEPGWNACFSPISLGDRDV